METPLIDGKLRLVYQEVEDLRFTGTLCAMLTLAFHKKKKITFRSLFIAA